MHSSGRRTDSTPRGGSGAERGRTRSRLRAGLLGSARGLSAPAAGSGAGGRTGPSRPLLGLVLAACAVLAAIQLPLAGIPDLMYPPGRLLPLWPQTLIWAAAGLIWGLAVRRIYLGLKRSAHRRNVFGGSIAPPSVSDDHRHVAVALWLCVAAVLCAVILPPMLVGQWTLQPVQMWHGLYTTYGMAGILASAGWLVHLCGFAMVTSLALAACQSLVETFLPRPWATRVPWGGLLIGLVGGLQQAVSGGLPAFVTALVALTLLGAVHLLTGRLLRWTAPAAALVLIFL
ncbi:hypothetical protein FCK90_05860 [Kocuria coralli]|uniref:CPBP family intramembrane metalloprotease n=1 Tax=Kocuria coralli TaxID=1461025 RepID=A0A5J5KYE7_9MICC|nr:hypothetical protein [Kocuria coralli]KAA9394693.1 hypothetical protein FCK90_05860 [Kocuria coralli]